MWCNCTAILLVWGLLRCAPTADLRRRMYTLLTGYAEVSLRRMAFENSCLLYRGLLQMRKIALLPIASQRLEQSKLLERVLHMSVKSTITWWLKSLSRPTRKTHLVWLKADTPCPLLRRAILSRSTTPMERDLSTMLVCSWDDCLSPTTWGTHSRFVCGCSLMPNGRGREQGIREPAISCMYFWMLFKFLQQLKLKMLHEWVQPLLHVLYNNPKHPLLCHS